MPTVLPAARYYPVLSEIITIDDLPESLGFIQEGLNGIFNRIHYKNLQYTKSFRGDSGFYSLEIVTTRRIQLGLPFGISMVLNPDFSGGDSNISAFPVSLEYHWEILAFLKSFDLRNFSFTLEEFYSTGLKIFKISEDQVMAHTLNFLVEPASTSVSKFQQVVDDINSFYGFSQSAGNLLQLPSGTEPTIQVLNNVIRQHPGINKTVSLLVFALYVADTSIAKTRENLNEFYKRHVPEGIEQFIKKLIKPRAKATFTLSAALEFPRNILKPVYDENGHNPYNSNTGAPLTVIAPDANGDPKAMLKFAEAVFYADTEEGIGYSLDIALSLATPVQIGNTPLILFIQNLKLDLSRTRNIVEADIDGRPADFMGVYVQEALVAFPTSWKHNSSSTAVIKGRNLLIGTGGISGYLSLERLQQTGEASALFKLGDATSGKHFELGLTAFSILFKQGAIVESDIQGYLKIPRFKDGNGDPAVINISAHIGNNGDFRVTASRQDQGIVDWNFEDLFRLTLNSISVGEENDKWYIEASGQLTITANIPGIGTSLSEQPIQIKKIRIWQNGKIEFDGGGISLPVNIRIAFGPVSLQLENISFNSHETWYIDRMRHYSVFGFNGSINTGPGGVNARGDGIEFHYTDDGLSPHHRYLRIAGIGVEIKIPGTASIEDADVYIKGYLAMRSGENANAVPDPSHPAAQTSPGTEYEGSVAFKINKLKIGGSAAMRMNPKVPAWIVDIELDIPVPITLGATGLGIYGFRGLIGSHYVASKPYIGLSEDDLWYEYLKKKVPPRNKIGIGIEKFDPKRKGFSLGVGASIATMGDNGWTFSSKVFVMLSAPEMLLIEGQANALHKRLGVEDEHDPPFYAFLVLDKHSIQAGLGVNYKVPDDGSILAIKGEMQLGFFFNNSSAWYLNIGKDMPEDKRVQARLLSLFNAYAYLMIGSKGIKAGAGAKFSLEAKFGPVRAGLYAFIDTKGFISFKPVQLGGAIQLGGGLYIRISRFKIEIHVAAGLSAEAPRPFIISGFIEVRIKIFIFKIGFKLQFTWVFRREPNTDEFKLLESTEFTPLNGEAAKLPAKARHMLSEEAFSVLCVEKSINDLGVSEITDDFIIPIDSFMDLEFKYPVRPYTNMYGGGVSPAPQYDVFVAPQKTVSPQVKHNLIIESVNIYIYDPTPNIPSNARWKSYNVWTPLLQAFQDLQLNVNAGTYPFGYWQYNNNPGKYTSLRILAQTPISVTNGTPVENFGILSEHILCQGKSRDYTCQDWENVEMKETFYPASTIFRERNLLMRFTKDSGYIARVNNPFGYGQALAIRPGNKLEIFFNEPVKSVHLHITTFNYGYVFFYSKVYTDAPTLAGLHSFEYQLVGKAWLDPKNTMEELNFDFGTPVSKVMIVAGNCGKSFVLMDELAPVWSELLEQYEGEPKDKLNEWRGHWIRLKEKNDGLRGELLQQWNVISESDHPVLRDYARSWQEKYSESETGARMLYDVSEQWKHLYNDTTEEALTDSEREIVHSWLNTYTPVLDPYKDLSGKYCSDWSDVLTGDGSEFKEAVQPWHDRYCENEPDVCALYLHEICWLTETDYSYNQVLIDNSQGSITTGINTLNQAINETLQPVWRPHSVYAIEVATRDEIYVNSGMHSAPVRKFVFAFKTAGSLGFFHQTQKAYNTLMLENRADQYQLANLKFYIDYARSYPDATGALVNAKPMYYKNPRLNLFFNKPYCYELFTRWTAYAGNEEVNYELWAYIKDPVDVDSANSAVTPKKIGWQVHKGQQSIPVNSLETETFSNILQSDKNCTGITTVLKPPTVSAVTTFEFLKPSKNYTAIFKAKEKKGTAAEKESIVHSYPFVTSRYESFRQHVRSYQRPVITNPETGSMEMVNAFFGIWKNGISFTSVHADYLKIIDDTHSPGDPILLNYASKYDRIVNGLFRIESPQAITGTEISLVKRISGADKKIMGILIRTPEPLNDPRLPLDQLARTIEVRDEIDGNNQFIVVYSKDNSCIFISNRNLDLAKRRHRITLKYVRYDGKAYTIDTSGASEDVVDIRLYLDRF